MTRECIAVDEYKHRRFLLAAVLIPGPAKAEVRQRLRGLRLPGLRGLHWKSDRKHRGRLIVDTVIDLAALGVSACVIDAGRGPETELVRRATALRLLLDNFAGPAPLELLLDRDETVESRDMRTISAHLATCDRSWSISARHVHRHDEPLVWLPDIVAGCHGGGGHWARDIRPLIKRVIHTS